MPKIKMGTATRAQDMLGRKVKVGDTIKDTRNGKEYTVVSSLSAKSTSDSEVLDIVKKSGSLLAFFQTTKAWNDTSEGDLDAAAPETNAELEKLKQALAAEQDKYANLLGSFEHCRNELTQATDEIIELKIEREKTSALNAELMSKNQELADLLSYTEKLNEGLTQELEAYKLREAIFDNTSGNTTAELIEELRRRGVRGELKVPQTVWTKYSLDDERSEQSES